MTNTKLEQARKLLDSFFDDIFKDDSRILSFLNIKGKSPHALVDELSLGLRYMAISHIKSKLNIYAMDPGIPDLIDQFESRGKKHMRSLVDKYLSKQESHMSDLLRPGRTI